MNSYPKFMLAATTGLLIGIPLWMAVLYPEMLSLRLFTSSVFWGIVASLLLVMLFGFWVGQRSEYT
ncbi:hypothetical protein BDK88_3750 [Natrinema hispanicum]|uniref:Uncharacterized protein n=1 Tax=Natrinema hispanicum TaxID=392421 RepID=A0A1I0JK79_9EURY|nr:hypothetical protein BDK88_3526 [Natrinema hispanicum]RZV06719.1 hypothetical protein BDK88_3750 [Natrinema hispanicum]SEU10516.1 hypothetical protein SAMN04488694_14613 [Natrinema hispanicum]